MPETLAIMKNTLETLRMVGECIVLEILFQRSQEHVLSTRCKLKQVLKFLFSNIYGNLFFMFYIDSQYVVDRVCKILFFYWVIKTLFNYTGLMERIEEYFHSH